MLLTIGSRLGAFVIEAPIGVGGMGEVYRATDSRLSRTVALKVLRPGSESTTGGTLQLLEREARAVAALNHPHICTLYDVGFEGTFGYLVMEYLEGQTLEQRLQDGTMALETAVIYARQLAGALAAAHAKGVIHRDLKPANLFLTHSGALKILDFGIAKLAPVAHIAETRAGITETGTFTGTVGYAAPEQLRGEAVDHRTDVFAVGAVLSELLSGAPPFARSSTVDTMSAILHEPPRSLPASVPAAFAAIIARCLEKDPARRFQSAIELLAAFDSPMAPVATPSATPPTAAPPSIAVLPFADLSPAKDQEYFCDGIADELIAALMGLTGVRVASRTSAFQFKGRAEDIGEIGRKLRVNNVLEGSVRRAGSQLRITVQLTDVAEGFQTWSRRYDRAVDDVFAVQDEIAHAIVEQLKIELGPKTGERIALPAPRNLDAYNLLLQGRYSVHKLTKDGLENGMAFYRQALELDPEYAEAHAELAHCFVLFAIFSVAPPRHVMPTATAAVARALAINPNLAQGQLSLAAARFWYEWDWTGAETAYRRALELMPGDGWTRMCYALFLGLRGRHDDALAEAKQAKEVDPVSLIISSLHIDILMLARRFDEAIDYGARAIMLEPSFFSSYRSLAVAQAGKGGYADAVATLDRGRPFAFGDAGYEGFLGWACGLAGDHSRAREIAQQLELRRESAYVAGSSIGRVYEGLGDMDDAMRWYRQAYDDRATECSSFSVAPNFDRARQDPRFRELIRLIESGVHEATM